MKSLSKLVGSAAVAAALVLGLAAAPPAYAASGTFYVDNSSPACSDTGPGSITTPWCSFTPANGTSFAAGSQILLRSGTTYNQALTPTGSGTATAWNVIGAYGSGPRPKIERNNAASDRGISLEDVSYWRIQDLEISRAGLGILVNYTTGGHQGLAFERLYMHDFTSIFHGVPAQTDNPRVYNSAAITVDVGGAPAPAAGQYIVRDIQFRDSETTRGTSLQLIGTPLGQSYTVMAAEGIKDVIVEQVWAHESPTPMFAFTPVANLHFISNYVDCSGHVFESQGTTCNYYYRTSNVVIANNVFTGMNITGSYDETAIDLEGKNDGTRISGNYFGSNAGAAVEMLQLANRPGDYSTNTVIDNNTFVDNGGSTTTGQKGHIAILNESGTTAPSGTISNNVYSTGGNGFISNVNGNPNTSNFTLTNNVASSEIYDSAWQFSGVQGANNWRQQYYNGSAWNDMPTHNPATNSWSAGSGAEINNFELIPGGSPNHWVGRTWVAPHAGTVQLRGQVFKDDLGGDGVYVMIEKNGSPIWPAAPTYITYQGISANDRNGLATQVGVSVAAGDVLRFIVWSGGNPTNDVTSWIPSVSYQ